MELASDYAPLCQPPTDDPDPDPTRLCNGYAAIQLAADPAAFGRDELAASANPSALPAVVTLPVPVSIDAASGHAMIDLGEEYRQLLYVFFGAPASSLQDLPSQLFFRPLLTPIYPDYMQYLFFRPHPHTPPWIK